MPLLVLARVRVDDVLEQPRLHDGRGVLRQDTALLPPYPAVILLFARRGGQGGQQVDDAGLWRWRAGMGADL